MSDEARKVALTHRLIAASIDSDTYSRAMGELSREIAAPPAPLPQQVISPPIPPERPGSAMLALKDAELVFGTHDADVRAVYDRAAARYDHFRKLWLRVGAPAERALIDDLRAVLRPGARVLDAGCGTGALSRAVLRIEPTTQLTMLDQSSEMLARAADVPGEHILGSVLALPFADNTFDIVVSGWVIETVPDPLAAVREYLRVIKPDGQVFYTFCSLPQGFFSRAGSAWLRGAVGRGFAGEFLPEERIPWHDCERSHRMRAPGGLVTEIALRKCCDVGQSVLPGDISDGTCDT